MKRLSLALLFGAACVASASTALAQDLGPGRFTVIPATRMAPPDSAAEQLSAVTSPTPLPTFGYTLLAYNGNMYSGSIVGRSPLFRGKTTTTIPTQLILQESQLASQALSFPSGSNNPRICANGQAGSVGVVDINTFDAAIQALITGPLAGMVNVGTFPIFLTQDVVLSENGSCCVLGYHSGLFVNGQLQIYSPFSIDTIPVFGGGFVGTLSHEMGEAINDPPGNNPTPNWGNIGQVVGACQNNFEVGDPLSPGFGTPTNPFTVVGGNGLTYTLQELAFYSWFYGSNGLGTGAGGKFSDNGTFKGDAIICPPGGTN